MVELIQPTSDVSPKIKKRAVSEKPEKKSSKKLGKKKKDETKVKKENKKATTNGEVAINGGATTKRKKSRKSVESEVDAPKKKKKKVKVEKTDMDSNEEEAPKNVEVDENSPENLGKFSKFRITDETINLLKKKGITYLFPIQIATFDHVYDGKDVVAQARTGTGKTMSFAIPLVEKLIEQNGHNLRGVWGRAPKVIVMAPTRELAIQVHSDFKCIQQNLASVCVYGGAPYGPQESAMRSGLDIVVGTPGRIQDHINKGNLKLNEINHVVLDEVDQMLDMGFAPIVEEILNYAYHKERAQPPQTLLFSATCPPWVKKTAKKYMREAETEFVDTIGSSFNKTATTVEHLAIRCHYSDRASCIANCVQMYSGQHGRAMIFTETKQEANELTVCEALEQQKAQVLHGDIEQRQREITLKAYRDGRIRCLVATNVAARGLDIPEIDLVIQASPPQDIESYIHRSGRTGRAGRTGVCICFYKPREEFAIQRVERSAGIKFKMVGPPQPKDIVQASINDTIQSLESIDKKLTAQFMDHAKTVADKHPGGALEALSAAIAWISGAGKLQSRSLLCSQPNMTTWQLGIGYEVRSGGFVYNTLEKCVGQEIREKAVGMRLTADKMGAVFDLPSELTDIVEERWTNSPTLQLHPCDQLPDLLPQASTMSRDNSNFHQSRGGRGRFGGSFRGRGGGGGRGYNNGGRSYNGRGSRGGFRGRGRY